MNASAALRYWVDVMPRASFPALFCGNKVASQESREFAQLATTISFGAGKTIFAEGEPADSAFGVSQGVVRLYKLLPDGRRQVVAFALPGDFLGMPLATRHSCYADAIGENAVDRLSDDGPLGAVRVMTIRGEPACGRGSIAPQPCIRWIRGPEP